MVNANPVRVENERYTTAVTQVMSSGLPPGWGLSLAPRTARPPRFDSSAARATAKGETYSGSWLRSYAAFARARQMASAVPSSPSYPACEP